MRNLQILKLGLATCAATLAAAGGVQASVIATLTFDTPTATVANNVNIPVYVTLALDPLSDPLSTDASGNVPLAILSAQNLIDLAGTTPNVIINNSFRCSGTFTSGCGPGAYAFNFNFAAPSFVDPPNLNLAPGSATSFLFGNFSPVGGHAAPGTYTFYNAAFVYERYDPSAPPGQQFHFSTIADTCPTEQAACAFQRTVFGVSGTPEPTGWAMMLTGFGLVGGGLRRRRTGDAGAA